MFEWRKEDLKPKNGEPEHIRAGAVAFEVEPKASSPCRCRLSHPLSRIAPCLYPRTPPPAPLATS